MEESQVCLDGEDLISVSDLGKHLSELKDELRGAQGDLDRLKQELCVRDSQLEKKTQELRNLTGKVKVIYLESFSSLILTKQQTYSLPQQSKERVQFENGCSGSPLTFMHYFLVKIWNYSVIVLVLMAQSPFILVGLYSRGKHRQCVGVVIHYTVAVYRFIVVFDFTK